MAVLDEFYPNRTCNTCDGFSMCMDGEYEFEEHNYCFKWRPEGFYDTEDDKKLKLKSEIKP